MFFASHHFYYSIAKIAFKTNAVNPVAEWLERLTLNHMVVGSNLGLFDKRSNRETSRIGFTALI